MNDADVEALLKKYRPLGPPVELRRRILRTGHMARIWPWAGAAAALLIMGLTCTLAARNAVAGANVNFGPSTSARVTEDLTNMLGGDRRAREMAEFIVVEQTVQRETMSTSMQVAAVNGEVRR